MKSLNKAIVAVMQQVRGMEKNTRVGTGNAAYDGTRDQDVKEAFNEALAANGLCIVPTSIEEDTDITRWEESTNYGIKQKQSVFTKVRTKYLLIHESGESIELAGYGHGVDPQDKSAGKALTYALKNTLLYTFLTPVGKIDDTETTHSNDIQQPVRVSAKEKVAQALADDSKKWFEIQWPFDKPEQYKGSELSTVAAAGDVQSFRKIETYLGDVLLEKYPQAHKNLDAAITEASNNKEERRLEGEAQALQHEDAGDRE